jgi:threonine dehydrogenase-like Zn-dependent dehydrogenase
MKALTFQDVGEVRVDEVPEPEIVDPGDVLLRIDTTAICGTDLAPLHGKLALEPDFILGHEYIGTVTAKGAGVENLEEGDRCVGSFMSCCGKCWYCRRGLFGMCSTVTVFGLGMAFGDTPGAQAEFLRVPRADTTLRTLPEVDGLTDEDYLFCGDIFTTAYDALYRAEIKPGDVVAIVGAGPVGLVAVQAAIAMGASQVAVIDMVEDRLKLAESFGAIPINASDVDPQDAVFDLTSWRGADIVMEAVGAEAALRSALLLARNGGTITVPGAHLGDEMELPWGDIWLRSLRLVCLGVGNIQAHIDDTLALVAGRKVDPAKIISHRMGLSEAESAYEIYDAKQAIKIVLDPAA